MYVNVMVVVVATRWFLSTHWHRYCTQATCSVVVFFGGGGRCTYAIVTVMVVGLFHPLQHMLVAFFSSLTGAEAVLALEQIALFGDGSGCSYGDMIATCTGGTLTFALCACRGCHWQQFTVVVLLPQPLAQTPLAPVVVSPIATCTGGVFPSTHWRRYQTYIRATCTVW